MRQQQSTYSQALRRFKKLSSQLNHLLQTETAEKKDLQNRQRLAHQLRGLYQALRRSTRQRKLRRILAGAAMLIGLGGAVQGQLIPNYPLGVTNPFSIQPQASLISTSTAIDIDGDGDLDLMAGEDYGSFTFYENRGTPQVPLFDTTVTLPFNITSIAPAVPFPTFGDLDNDGDYDMIVWENYYGRFYFYENIGTPTAADFAPPVLDTLGLNSVGYFVIPQLVDLDSDGDLDMMTGGYYGAITYYENVGDSVNADFDVPSTNPFGASAGNYFAVPRFGDFDSDGDLDLLYTDYGGNYKYFENTGTATAPSFAAPVLNPWGLQADNYYNFHTIADFDADGDLDIMEGEYYGVFEYYENMPIVSNTPAFQVGDLSIAPNPSAGPMRIDYRSDDLTENVVLKIFGLDGRLVHQWQVEGEGNGFRAEYDTGALASGMYILEVDLGEKKLRERFTRQ